jgi:protein phosphatase
MFAMKKNLQGPFDIIGDIHGCFEECLELLQTIGYQIKRDEQSKYGFQVTNPPGRTAVFVGDLTDRGPNSVDSLRLVMTMVENEQALCILGNHEAKLVKKLSGRNVQVKNGLETTMAELDRESATFREEVRRFVENLPIQLVLDDGKLVIAHAGLPEHYHGKQSKAVTSHAIYGDVSGKTDEHGLPIRRDWTLDYKGQSIVVYGHVPRQESYLSNKTYGIDTGCVFGGKLTCLKYPELEFVDVKAKKIYSQHAHLQF